MISPSWFPGEFSWVVGGTYAGVHVRDGALRNPIRPHMAARADGLRRPRGGARRRAAARRWLHVGPRTPQARIFRQRPSENRRQRRELRRDGILHPDRPPTPWRLLGVSAGDARVHHAVPAQRAT